jgi:hypothetical protein
MAENDRVDGEGGSAAGPEIRGAFEPQPVLFLPPAKTVETGLAHGAAGPDQPDQAVEDALQGVWFEDDSAIIEHHTLKLYHDSREEVRISLEEMEVE